jgi:hypothetical protein
MPSNMPLAIDETPLTPASLNDAVLAVETQLLGAASAAGTTLVLGTAWQNTTGKPVTLVVSLAVTANTSLVLALGVGPTVTPTQQTIVTGTTATGVFAIPIKVPPLFYALLSASGTQTSALVGQIQYPN